jgi:PhzF family phenazine biosynthesis protein
VRRQFRQVDVFSSEPCLGNPVAVVLDADGLTSARMQLFARWTNLSETTFVLPPRAADADYRVRIFTPVADLPFAGHPTLGTCHAWLAAGHLPRRDGLVVQECGAGLVSVRRAGQLLAFAAPPLVRSGPADEETIRHAARVLGISRDDVADAQWADNGPGWLALLLHGADAVLALRPGYVDMDIGVAGLYPPGSEAAAEVRAFFPKDGTTVEDPVTGSFNASLAQWLLGTGRLTAPYIASQGTALGRRGRVHVSADADGTVWVAGACTTLVSGQADLREAGTAAAPG